ncbi:MarR family winged helix-turn-helix transcriptional regulator [Streptomyces misionensis]|uniref:MarR family winged helix-turn-helix transcriptional regulator n=1 Tax=Streptomyces misionensis TaxID=67331 RepID=UPI0036CE7BB7
MVEESAARWLTETEMSVWRRHLEVGKLVTYQMEKGLRPFGLTMHDYEVLVLLSESEGARMRMSEVAAATGQSKSRLSHQITRLEKAHLVRRENSASDRRGLFAVLTERGRETLSQVTPHHVASLREHFVDLLPPDGWADLERTLGPVVRHARADKRHR